MIVIEAEHYDDMRADTVSGQVWELRTDDVPDEASNGEYMKAPMPNTNDTNYGNLSDAVAEAPRLDYVCQLEGGTYIVWARGTNDGGGSDTIHFGINFAGNGAQPDGVDNSINGIDFDNDAFMWSKKHKTAVTKSLSPRQVNMSSMSISVKMAVDSISLSSRPI